MEKNPIFFVSGRKKLFSSALMSEMTGRYLWHPPDRILNSYEKILLGLTKYLVYCLTVIWLKNIQNIRHLLRYLSQLIWNQWYITEWIRHTAVLAIPFLILFYGCEDFDAPEKEKSVVTQDSDNGGASSSSLDSRKDGSVASDMDASSDEEVDAAKEDAGEETLDLRPTPLKQDYVVPQAGKEFIFVPNSKNHCVTLIDIVSYVDGESNFYECIECDPDDGMERGDCVGKEPTYLGVYSGSGSRNKAIVVDKAEDRAAIVVVSRSKAAVNALDIVANVNVIRFAPGGSHAVLYHDPNYEGGEGENATGSYQEVSVINLEEKTSSNMIVGLRPRELVFDNEGEDALFITDEGISIINFRDVDQGEASVFAPTVDFQGKIDPATAVISIAPGGRFAIGYEPMGHELVQLDISTWNQSDSTTEVVTSVDMNLFFKPEIDEEAENEEETEEGEYDDAGVSDEEEEEKLDPRSIIPKGVVPGIADMAINPSLRDSYVLVTIPEPGLVLKIDIPWSATDEESDLLETAGFYLVNEQYDSVVISSEGKTAGETALAYNRSENGFRATLLKDMTGDAPPAMEDENWEFWAIDHIKHFKVAYPIDTAEFINLNNTILAIHKADPTGSADRTANGYSIIDVAEGVANYKPTTNLPDSYLTYKKSLFVSYQDKDAVKTLLQTIELNDFVVKTIELNGKSDAMGVFLDSNVNRMFVSVQHPSGHIVLMDSEGRYVAKPLIGFQILDRVQE